MNKQNLNEEIPQITVTPPEGNEKEGTVSKEEGTATQTEDTVTDKKETGGKKGTPPSNEKTKIKAADCINAAAPLFNLIGKDLGGNAGVTAGLSVPKPGYCQGGARR